MRRWRLIRQPVGLDRLQREQAFELFQKFRVAAGQESLYDKLSKEELIRKLMLGKMQQREYAEGRNQEIRSWVEEHPEIKARVEERIRNVPAANRERAFINAAKQEAMNQTVRSNGIRA